MAKKVKSDPESQSKIFDHFRSVGLVLDEVPFALLSRGSSAFVTTSIGRAFHIYDFVSDEYESKIVALASNDDDTYVVTRAGFLRRVERAKVMEKISCPSDVVKIEVLGDKLLVLTSKVLLVYTLDLKKVLNEVEFSREATCMVHPHTYINKVLIGFIDGGLELWNFNSGKLIYTFNCIVNPSKVKCLAQSTVVDVLAAGLEDGRVVIFDARQDAVVFEVRQKAPVSSVSFRSGERAQVAVADVDGLLSVWDLEGRTMILLVDAHEKAISRAEFLPGLPVLLTSSEDNSLKEWALSMSGDQKQEEIRLLRSRIGHSAPPKIVRFWDDSGVLSCGGEGDGSLRFNSLIKDSQSHELSQGNLESRAKKQKTRISALRFSPVVDLAFYRTRETGWANIVTAHESSAIARSWRFENKCASGQDFNGAATVTAVATSPCGNFGLIGTSTGQAQLFNLQSGQVRRTFQIKDQVIGLAVDQFSKELLVVGKDGSIHVFDFDRPSKTLLVDQLDKGVSSFAFKQESSLAAISQIDGLIKIFDLEARRTVRILKNDSAAVDLAFSGDGKWLLACSSEKKTVSTWDLPSGLLVDRLVCKEAPLSVSVSPNGEFIATVHEGDKSIHVWSNRTILKPVSLGQKSVTAVTEVPFGVSLADGPRSKWSTVVNLDAIKARSKPEMPSEAPPLAPFFLDAILQQKETGQKRDTEGEPLPTCELMEALKLESLLSQLNEDVFKYLMDCPVSQLHLELVNLNSAESLKRLISLLTAELRAGRNWDMVQAVIGVTLDYHSETLMTAEYKDVLAELEAAQRASWTGIESLLNQALCLSAFCRDRY